MSLAETIGHFTAEMMRLAPYAKIEWFREAIDANLPTSFAVTPVCERLYVRVTIFKMPEDGLLKREVREVSEVGIVANPNALECDREMAVKFAHTIHVSLGKRIKSSG